MDPLARIAPVPLRIDPAPPLGRVRREEERPPQDQRRHPSPDPDEQDADGDEELPHVDVLA
jgi:hypothetical protein